MDLIVDNNYRDESVSMNDNKKAPSTVGFWVTQAILQPIKNRIINTEKRDFSRVLVIGPYSILAHRPDSRRETRGQVQCGFYEGGFGIWCFEF
jgi:hypothetical protein